MEQRLKRRDFLKIATTSLILGLTGLGRYKGQPYYPSEIEQYDRLQEAGLENFFGFYGAQKRMFDRYGVFIFPEITGVLFGAAYGKLDQDQPEIKILSDGWPEERKSQKLVTDATNIVKKIELKSCNDQFQVREIFLRLALVLPGLWINAPPRFNYNNLASDGKRRTLYRSSEIWMDHPPEFADAAIEPYYHALFHELSHAIDDNGLKLEDIERLKKYIPLRDVIRFIQTYSEVVYEVMDAWSKVDLHKALEFKGGIPLVGTPNPPFSDEVWRSKAVSLAELMERDESWLKNKIGEFNSATNRNIPYDNENYLFNIAANFLIRKIRKASIFDQIEHNFFKSNRFSHFLRIITKEVAHFYVGSGFTEFKSDFLGDIVEEEAARLEKARLSMLSINGKAFDMYQLRKSLFPELIS